VCVVRIKLFREANRLFFLIMFVEIINRPISCIGEIDKKGTLYNKINNSLK